MTSPADCCKVSVAAINIGYDAKTLRHDLAGGITSALVVLPLALAFGVVSGLGAAAGLYGAVAVGFFAAVFGGTKVQISGATAPMAVAMSFIVAHYADSGPEALTIIVLAGLIQIHSALANDTECIVMGLRGLPATSLQSLDALRRVPGDHFVESLDDARAIAERLLVR